VTAVTVELDTWVDPGGLHLASLDRDERRAAGVVYTPSAVAEFVVELALDGCDEQLLDGPVLDPACGAGAFLLVVAKRLAARVALNVDLGSAEGHARLLQAMERSLFGIDVDETAVALCRRQLRELTKQLSPGRIPNNYLTTNIRVADFLAPDSELLRLKPTLIVGNPPYVPVDRIPSELAARLRRDFSTARGRVDLYTVFMEQASEVLALGGRWAFITPDKFLTNESSSSLRAYLAEHGSLATICRFEAHNIFSGAATVPCITVWDRSSPRKPLTFLLGDVVSGVGVAVRASERWSRNRVRGSSWDLGRQRDRALIDRIRGNHPTVADVVTRVSAGPATGLNEAFLLAPERQSKVEQELLHPVAAGRDITAMTVADRGIRILLPYEFDAAGGTTLISLDDYPLAKRWLTRHRPQLLDRHSVRVWGHAWWDLHDPLKHALHLRPKVLVPDLARTNRFAPDSGLAMPLHSAYYLLPKPDICPTVLAALLNSQANNLLMHATAPIAKDGFRRFRRQFLITLPVPEIDESVAIRIRELAKAGLQSQLSALVDACFGIDPEELRAARSIP
jgi:adenine-specific DNA-methyltransferase